MNRKIISILIALALLIALMPAALAMDAASDGKIQFVAGNLDDDGVYDPGDKDDPDFPLKPDDPNDPNDPVNKFLDKLNAMALYFGEQEIDLVNNQTYPSVKADGTTPDMAGILVLSHATTWEVYVAISGFKIGNAQTIKGFDMDLTSENNTGYTFGDGQSAITPISITGLAAGDNGIPGDADRIATGTQGVTGANYSAKLNVLANTAQVGNATADLFWTYVVVAD